MLKFVCCFLFIFPFWAVAQQGQLTSIVQKGHSSAVMAADYSADGKLVATAGSDHTVKLWDAATKLEITSFFGHRFAVNHVAFSPNGKYLVSTSDDNTALVRDIHTREVVKKFTAKNYITSAAFSPDNKWIALAGYDRNLLVFNLVTGDTLHTMQTDPTVTGDGIEVQFSPDGKWLAIGEDDRTLRLVNTDTWKVAHTLRSDGGMCGGCATKVAFSSDSRHLALSVKNGRTALYDIKDSVTLTHTFFRNKRDIKSIDISKDGKLLLVAKKDSIFLWDIKTKKRLSAISPDVEKINNVIFDPDNNFLVSGNNNQASVWNQAGKKLGAFSGILEQRHEQGMGYDPDDFWERNIARYVDYKNSLSITEDGKYIVNGKIGKKARMWELNSGKIKVDYTGHEKTVLCSVMDEGEGWLLTGGGDGKAILWELNTGKKIRAFEGHNEVIFDVAISHDKQKVATCGWDGYVIVWDLNTGKPLSSFKSTSSAYNIAFSPNDVYVLVTRLNNAVELWEYESRQMVRDFKGHQDIVTSLQWSPQDDQTFATTGRDGNILLWDVASGLIKQRIKSEEAVFDALFYKDHQLITAGADRVIRFHDLNTGKVLHELKGHQAAVTALSVNKEKQLLATGDKDGVIKLWHLHSKEEFFEHIQINEREWMVRTTDGHFYATEGAMSVVHFVRGLKTYHAEQFFETFFKPDLLPELFEKKVKSEGETIEGMLDDSPPPSLKFGVIPDHNGMNVTLKLKVTDNGGGIHDVQLFHNGKRLTQEQVAFKRLERTKQHEIYEMTAALVSGHNVFSAKAFSDQHIASHMAEADVVSDNDMPGSICHVLAVGINTYKNPSLSLKYARQDAESFVSALETTSGGMYADMSFNRLYDEKATKDNILQQLDSLAGKVQMNDVFIFYFAGHGSVSGDQFFFSPTEATRLYDDQKLQKESIAAAEIQQKLKKIRALKQVIIMDACQAGNSAELLALRGGLEERAIAQLARSTGIHVLASAGGEQFASEFAALGHGVFTYSLLQGLEGAADGSPEDGKITIYEIKSYLDDQVPQLSLKYKGRPQYPYSFSRGHDFPISLSRP